MLLELEEMLKSDWVAVLPHVFKESEYHKFMFTAAWNKIEGSLPYPARAGWPRGRGAVPRNRLGLLSQMEATASAIALPSPRPQKSPAWAEDGSVFSACNPGGILSSPVSGQQRIPSMALGRARQDCFTEARNPEFGSQLPCQPLRSPWCLPCQW